ncbi:electron transport complex subunit RsxE [Arenimonas sp.]|uniref:electron transport complex subunit RsxE n=1 Tax=Arenimonas sp. TaxID=1872635 RepID=UPI0039E4FD90
MNTTPRRILEYGVSSGNVGLVQLLGLCPLLAVSHNTLNALGLGLATLLALVLTNLAVASIRRLTHRDVRIPIFATVIAAVVTAIELAMRAWLPELHAVIGLFVPLIASNCALLGRAEAFASRQSPARAAIDGFAAGLGFLWVLLAVGAIRELIGSGRLFAEAGRLLHAPWLEWHPLPGYEGLLLATLPIGAFLALACLIAMRQAWRQRRSVDS